MKFTDLNVTLSGDSKICTETLSGQKGYTTPDQIKGITQIDSLLKNNNLSEIANKSQARMNLELGDVATLSVGDGPGNVITLDSLTGKLPAVDGSNLLNLPIPSGILTQSGNLFGINNPSAARVNLELGSASVEPVSSFEANLSNPLADGYILSSTISGIRSWIVAPSGSGSGMEGSNNLSELTDLLIARGNLGLGTASTESASVFENDLGLPTTDGQVLSSNTAGIRVWIDPSAATVGRLLAANNLSDLISESTARINLGLGTAATKSDAFFEPNLGLPGGSSNKVLISTPDGNRSWATQSVFEQPLGDPSTDGHILSSTTSGVRSWIPQVLGGGVGDLLSTNNLSDVTNVSTARINLGLEIGVNAQAFSINLNNWSAKIAPSGAVIGSTDSQTLVNKVISGIGNTLTVRLGSDVTGDLPVTNLAGGAGASASTYWRGDGTWATMSFAGEPVLGNPATSGFILSSTTAGVRSWIAPSSGGLVNFNDTLNIASPHTTVTSAMLSVTGAASNIDMVISPKGTGALSSQQADNGAAKGNKRGSYAVDWQSLRSIATRVASGSSSVISGGENNTASGISSSVGGGSFNLATGNLSNIAGGDQNIASGEKSSISGGTSNTASGVSSFSVGQSNTASSNRSIAMGQGNISSGANSASIGINNTAQGVESFAIGSSNLANGANSCVTGNSGSSNTVIGAIIYASGKFSVAGDAQKGIYVLRATTANATQSSLFTNGINSATSRILISANSTYAFSGMVSARKADGTSSGWKFSGTIKRGGPVATTVIMGAVIGTPDMDAGAATWALNIAADTVNGSLDVRVTGGASDTIRWVATVETCEVGF